MRKYFGDTLWIDSSLQHIDSNIIISDLRFRVEEEAVHKFNGTIIYIERPETKPGNHASEKEVIQLKEENKFDYENMINEAVDTITTIKVSDKVEEEFEKLL